MYLDRMIILAIGGYALLDAIRRRYLPMQREIYLLVFVAIVGLLLVRVFNNEKSRLDLHWAWLGAVVLSVYAIAPIGSHVFDAVYYIGDLVIVLFLVSLLAATRIMPELFQDRSNRLLLMLCLLAAMFVAPAVHLLAPTDDQFAPPHMLLMAGTWAAVAVAPAGRGRWALVLLLVLELAVSYSSQQRTNVVLWFGFGGLVALMCLSLKQKLMGGLLLIGVALLALGPGASVTRSVAKTMATSVIQGSRFELIQEGPDESLLGRYLEVQDVWLNMKTDWAGTDWLIGAGHGATFRPFYWYPERNMKDGRTHNIHFGPVLVIFRYGLVGLAVLCYFAWKVAATILRPGRTVDTGWENWWTLTVWLGAVGVLLTFLLFNTFQDPVVAFITAAFFGMNAPSSSPDSNPEPVPGDRPLSAGV